MSKLTMTALGLALGLTLGLGLGVVAPASAQGNAADPNYRTPGIYIVEQDDVEAHFVVGDGAWGDVIATLAALRESPAENNAAIADELWSSRDENAPIFLFEVARRSVETNPERALEAYFLGRVRAIYDARRCLDSTALEVVNVSTQYAGEAATNLIAERIDEVPAVLDRLAQSGEAFSSNASPWWACSFGDSAYYAATNSAPMTGPEWLKLETNWPSIETDVSASLSEDAARLRASLAEQDG